MHRFGVFLAAAFLVVGSAAITADEPGPPVKPRAKWSGKFQDNKDLPLRMLVPKKGYLVEEKAFAALWKEWRPKEDLPKIDFDKEIVFVSSGLCAANDIAIHFTLKDGNLTSKSIASLVSGPGFSYVIVVVSREGVKTINGNPIVK